MTASGDQSSTSTLVHPPTSSSSFGRSDLVVAEDGGAGRAVGIGPGEAVVRHCDRNVRIIAAATDSGPDRAL
jgi:hypothetical protein